MPKVSVIIPIYNVEKYLRECLDSVVNQTLKDIEIICINDGSTDNSGLILEEYGNNDKRIKVIHKENEGAAIARNVGLKIAEGEYLSILDSDDYFELNMLEDMYKEAVENDLDIIICRAKDLDNITKEIKENKNSIKKEYLPNKDIFNYKDIPNYIFNFSVGWSWDKLYKRDFIQKNKLEFQNLRSTNDAYFVFISLVLAEKISIIDNSYIIHRRNTNTQLSETRYKEPNCFINAIKKIKESLFELNLYNKVEISFINWIINFTFWQLSTLPRDINKRELIKNLVEEYKLKTVNKRIIQNIKNYNKLKKKYINNSIIQFKFSNEITHKIIDYLRK